MDRHPRTFNLISPNRNTTIRIELEVLKRNSGSPREINDGDVDAGDGYLPLRRPDAHRIHKAPRRAGGDGHGPTHLGEVVAGVPTIAGHVEAIVFVVVLWAEVGAVAELGERGDRVVGSVYFVEVAAEGGEVDVGGEDVMRVKYDDTVNTRKAEKEW